MQLVNVLKTDSLNLFTRLLAPNSDHVMSHLGGYNCAICYTQLITREYVQTEQL